MLNLGVLVGGGGPGGLELGYAGKGTECSGIIRKEQARREGWERQPLLYWGGGNTAGLWGSQVQPLPKRLRRSCSAPLQIGLAVKGC